MTGEKKKGLDEWLGRIGLSSSMLSSLLRSFSRSVRSPFSFSPRPSFSAAEEDDQEELP